jgi:hypothetical protein
VSVLCGGGCRFLDLWVNLFRWGIWDAAFFGACFPVKVLQIFQRKLPPLHQLGSNGIHSGRPPFSTRAVLASQALLSGVFDEVAGDPALRSAVDSELFEDAARGLTAGYHALARIGDKGGCRKLRGW